MYRRVRSGGNELKKKIKNKPYVSENLYIKRWRIITFIIYYAILCMLFPYVISSVRTFMNASVLTFVRYFLFIALQSCIIAFACFCM